MKLRRDGANLCRETPRTQTMCEGFAQTQRLWTPWGTWREKEDILGYIVIVLGQPELCEE